MFVIFIASGVIAYLGFKFIFAVRDAMKAVKEDEDKPRRKRALDFKW